MLTGLALILAVSPSPSASPAAQCPRDVEVLKAVAPEIDVRQLPVHMPHDGISVAVDVTVGPDGKPVEAHTVQSSGFMFIDAAALDAVRRSSWKPKMVLGNDGTCKPVTGTYLFKATITPNQ